VRGLKKKELKGRLQNERKKSTMLLIGYCLHHITPPKNWVIKYSQKERQKTVFTTQMLNLKELKTEEAMQIERK